MIEMPIGSIRPNKMYLGLGADETAISTRNSDSSWRNWLGTGPVQKAGHATNFGLNSNA